MKDWNKKYISSEKELELMLQELKEDNPKYVGMDTETTGLNIINDKAFLVVIGWMNSFENKKVFTVDTSLLLETKLWIMLYKALERADYVFFWNTKYDLHMLKNTGMEYPFNNVSDGMIIARILEPIEAKKFGLKHIASTYVDSNAKEQQDYLKQFQQELKKPRLSELTLLVKPYKYNFGKIMKALKDPLIGFEKLPKEVKDIYVGWAKKYNHDNLYEVYNPSYLELYKENPELMIQYASDDVIYMMEFVQGEKTRAIDWIFNDRCKDTFIRESRLIKPLYEQENEGWCVDLDYLNKSIEDVKETIAHLRVKLETLAGQPLTAAQHVVIKQLINNKFKHTYVVDKTNKASLTIISEETKDEFLKSFVSTILDLRTLEKWYSTYLIRILRNINNSPDKRLRTNFNHTSVVTGRLSSDFQQFPKEGVVIDGKELFNPRKLIIVEGGDYPNMLFFDYSQIELRVQAEHIISEGMIDKNLTSAFKNINNDPNWTPTDLHGLNVKTAFGIDESHPDFHKLRVLGKILSFALLYGASKGALINNTALRKISEGEIVKLYDAYAINFPKVIEWQKLVKSRVEQEGKAYNLYNRLYTYADINRSYTITNYLVQGTSADFLKEKMILIYDFVKVNNLKTKILGSVHDEIQFAIHKDEMFIIPRIKELMEESNTYVPIVVDVEITHTNWASKVDYKIKED